MAQKIFTLLKKKKYVGDVVLEKKSKKFKFKYDDGKLSRIDETKFNNHISKKVYDIIKKEYKNNRRNKK